MTKAPTPTEMSTKQRENTQTQQKGEVNWLFNVTINNISVIHVTSHRCAGELKKK